MCRGVVLIFSSGRRHTSCAVVTGVQTCALPISWKTIRLELARAPDFPVGSPAHGYELRAPLAADGHLDAELFRSAREKATLRRFWRGEPDKTGDLTHTRSGWAFSYEPGDADRKSTRLNSSH